MKSKSESTPKLVRGQTRGQSEKIVALSSYNSDKHHCQAEATLCVISLRFVGEGRASMKSVRTASSADMKYTESHAKSRFTKTFSAMPKKLEYSEILDESAK